MGLTEILINFCRGYQEGDSFAELDSGLEVVWPEEKRRIPYTKEVKMFENLVEIHQLNLDSIRSHLKYRGFFWKIGFRLGYKESFKAYKCLINHCEFIEGFLKGRDFKELPEEDKEELSYKLREMDKTESYKEELKINIERRLNEIERK